MDTISYSITLKERLERLAEDKHSSLLASLKNGEKMKCWPVATDAHFKGPGKLTD
jgi:hypothetical protein